jgi:hypothetical protein
MKSDQTPWGRAHPHRGKNRRLVAVNFVRQFSIGSSLTSDELDGFFETQGLLKIPEERTPGSPEWTKHVDVRFREKDKLNKASTHPQMAINGATPFYLRFDRGSQLYCVLDPVKAVVEYGVEKKQDSNTRTRTHEVELIAQSREQYDELEWVLIDSTLSRLESLNRINKTIAEEQERNTRELNAHIERIKRMRLANGDK